MDKLTAFTSEQLKETVPAFEIGDTVKVYNKIIEGTRERIQISRVRLFQSTAAGSRNPLPFVM